MDNDSWVYDSVMAEETNMDEDNGGQSFAFENNNLSIDCSEAFNTSKVFNSREEVLEWARGVAYNIGFVVVIMRSDTATGKRGRTSFLLIGCERSGKYRPFKKDLVTLQDGCPIPPAAFLWSRHRHHQAQQWPSSYIGRMNKYTTSTRLTTENVVLE